MSDERTDSTAMHLSSPSGMRVELNANGSIRRFDCNGISLELFLGTELEGGPANLYLRRTSESAGATPLLGPRSATRFRVDPATGLLIGEGAWQGLNYWVALVLAQSAPAWFWHVRIENTTTTAQEIDLTYAQDLALAPYGAVRLNEYYVSQYVDHTPLSHPAHGFVIASRQNLAAEGRHPWSLIGSLRNGVAFATDALQFHSLASRRGDPPSGLNADLPGRRLQHEHSMVVIRDTPVTLGSNESVTTGFFGLYVPDHPQATNASDLARVAETLALPQARAPASSSMGGTRTGPRAAETLFSSAPPLNGLDLDDSSLRAFFGLPWRHEELDEHGTRLSFFYDKDRHVVLRAKEARVLRPHGHLLRTGRHLTPDETALTSTAWMAGVFNSMLTQGHVSINRLLSTVHSYLGLFRSNGQRVFTKLRGEWRLLNIPSAFEMGPSFCRWIYRHEDDVIQVRTEAKSDPHELLLTIEVSSGQPLQFLIAHHIALDGDDGSTPGAAHWAHDGNDIRIVPPPGSWLASRFPNGGFRIIPTSGTRLEQVAGDDLLFMDGQSRQQPYVCLVTSATSRVGLSIQGQLITENAERGSTHGSSASTSTGGGSTDRSDDAAIPLHVDTADHLIPTVTLRAPSGSPLADAASRLADIVPWYTQNALVHYLSPRGLEQYSGGGWGTRDVTQGPVEMLLALGRTDGIRDLLLRVMANQNPDGDWPQWFMFFDRDRGIRAGDSHGDIVFWPVLVVAQYLLASGDSSILNETVRFFDPHDSQKGESATVWQHVERALAVMQKRVIAGTALPAYGHGDWNDSLQPADPSLRDHMCSAWTATLQYQCLVSLAEAFNTLGRASEAVRFEHWAEALKRDFQRLLVADGVLAGYALFGDAGRVRYLLHPSDDTTGVRYSSLAMIHAILEDMLTPEQTREHLRLIERQLSGPDGVRLFDRPMPYRGGPERLFQRAESATFFGREIGLMYMHAHLRYAQALAHVGEADRFFHALCQANPISIRSIVPSATLRQANCYYSSSDAAFEDRYQASAEYDRVAHGTIALDGGWRVYSSGAGIALGLILRRFLGLSREARHLRIDPVIPSALDGLEVEITLFGRPAKVNYRIGAAGCGVNEITWNGQALSFTRESNPHRPGAALVDSSALEPLARERNALQITIG